MATRMQQRRGTASQWTTANPVLAAGEIGFEIDTNKFKMGDGINQWDDLDYFASADAIADLIDGAPELLDTLNELAAAIGDDPNFANNLANAFAEADLAVLAAAQQDADAKANAAAASANSYTDGKFDAEAESRQIAIDTHANTTINIHGISNTAALAYDTDVENARTNAIATAEAYANSLAENYDANGTATNAVSNHNLDTSNVHGIANTLALITNSGDQTIDGVLTLSGLIVQGNTTVVNTTDLFVQDPLIYLASNQYDTDLVDIGITGAYGTTGGTEEDHLHTGLVRDVTDKKWKLFSNAAHPVSNEIAFTDGVVADTLVIGDLESRNISANSIALTNGFTLGEVTSDNIIFLANTTSNIQTQLNSKAPLNSPVFTGLVTVAANGISFTDGTQTKEAVPSRTVIHQKTDSYTLSSLDERDDLIEINKSTATTLTIPLDSTLNYPIGTSIDVVQTGTGQVTIAGTGGVTVNATPGLKLRSQWSSATLFKRAANTWLVLGDLSA
jgi:hypothetical protein